MGNQIRESFRESCNLLGKEFTRKHRRIAQSDRNWVKKKFHRLLLPKRLAGELGALAPLWVTMAADETSVMASSAADLH